MLNKFYSVCSVLAKGLNDGGRGFNIAVVDHKKKDVIRVGHFDTYAEGEFVKNKHVLLLFNLMHITNYYLLNLLEQTVVIWRSSWKWSMMKILW